MDDRILQPFPTVPPVMFTFLVSFLVLASPPKQKINMLMNTQTVAVLDTVEGVYVWRGRLSDTSQYDIICRACEEYCPNKPLPVGRRVIKVREGHEPLVFRARFQAWDDGGPGEIKKFQDLYEQRMVQMSVSLLAGVVFVILVWFRGK